MLQKIFDGCLAVFIVAALGTGFVYAMYSAYSYSTGLGLFLTFLSVLGVAVACVGTVPDHE